MLISARVVCHHPTCHSVFTSRLSLNFWFPNSFALALETLIFPLVLYGFETLSLVLREERRLRVFENRVLRRIFGPKRDEVTGEWRKLLNEELNDLYSS